MNAEGIPATGVGIRGEKNVKVIIKIITLKKH